MSHSISYVNHVHPSVTTSSCHGNNCTILSYSLNWNYLFKTAERFNLWFRGFLSNTSNECYDKLNTEAPLCVMVIWYPNWWLTPRCLLYQQNIIINPKTPDHDKFPLFVFLTLASRPIVSIFVPTPHYSLRNSACLHLSTSNVVNEVTAIEHVSTSFSGPLKYIRRGHVTPPQSRYRYIVA